MEKTKNYGMFKFRNDNRNEINPNSVKELVTKIQEKNLLHLCPILVNEDMEIFNGQHRLKAAEILGVDIYYETSSDLTNKDIIALNNGKSWKLIDYFNFYLKNGYPEYHKLKDFMQKHGVSIRTAFCMTTSTSKKEMKNFKMGDYVYSEDATDEVMEVIIQSVAIIKAYCGHGHWIDSGRLWKAFKLLFSQENFNLDIWIRNLKRSLGKIAPQATFKGNVQMVEGIYNFGLKTEGSRLSIADGVQ